MKRGDIVIVSAPGQYGNPRPAVVIQSDGLTMTESVLVCLLTSEVEEAPYFRLTLQPNNGNGLTATSQVMVDKIVALPRTKCSGPVGSLDPTEVMALNQRLTVVIGLAD